MLADRAQPRQSGETVSVAVESEPLAPAAVHHRTVSALRAARGHLKGHALKLLLFGVIAFLLLRLTPSLTQAFDSLGRVAWQWLVLVLALETLSELGYVVAWRQIVDPDRVLEQTGCGRRFDTRLAWAQLGGGLLVPAGSFSGVGAGAVLLHRFGIPLERVAKREFNLSFLNTGIDALALVFFGLLLSLGILSGKHDLTLTLIPAAVAAAGVAAAIVIARRAERFAARVESRHGRIAAAVGTVAGAVDDTKKLVFQRGDWRSLAGAVAFLGFDVLVLWVAFYAVHAHTVPAFAAVLMAYIIGALGGSLPLPAGIGAIGGIAGCLVLYGADANAAAGAAVLYGAIGLIVPLVGGVIAYLLLRRQLAAARAAPSAGAHARSEAAADHAPQVTPTRPGAGTTRS
jgi:uncharacterized membrane protein YbhN (UPF0104 family)